MKYHVAFLCLILNAACHETPPPSPLFPVPTPSQMAWHEMETNAFIHFSINTFTDKEWGYGDEDPRLFDPKSLDVHQWVATLKEAGFKTIILTSKHHDGFCLWPSKYTEHSIKSSRYKNGKGDLVRELADEVKRNGLKFGIYLSPWDRNNSAYGTPAYIVYYRDQIRELFGAYGPITEMWFDGANGGDGYYGGANENRYIDKIHYYDWPATLKLARSFAPDVLFFSDAGPDIRWVGNELGIAGETNWNTITTDTLYAGKAGIELLLNTGSEKGKKWVPAEVDVSIRPGWFYHSREDSLVKDSKRLFEIYLTSVGRGSTLLLNVPPDRDGVIHATDVKALREWRALIEKTFANNLALGQKVAASSVRGNSQQYAASNVNDANPETYWATDDSVSSGSIEIDLRKPRAIAYVELQEYIKLGQRVQSFSVEGLTTDGWTKLTHGTTIGYKRILKCPPISISRLKLTIIRSRVCPLISELKIY